VLRLQRLRGRLRTPFFVCACVCVGSAPRPPLLTALGGCLVGWTAYARPMPPATSSRVRRLCAPVRVCQCTCAVLCLRCCRYTAKVAGTERGIKEPEATFSSCFGAAFMTLHPTRYADLFLSKLQKHNVKCYLVNTGWTGGCVCASRRVAVCRPLGCPRSHAPSI
jgi:hypothetical protein